MATGSILLPVAAATPDPTDPPGSLWTADNVRYLAFDAATPEIILYSFRLPTDFESAPLLQIQWSHSVSSTGNVRWGCQISKVTPNSDTDDMTSTRTFDTENTAADAGVATRRLQEVEMTLSNFDSAVAKDNITLKFYRDADDAADTLNSEDAYLWALSLEYTTT